MIRNLLLIASLSFYSWSDSTNYGNAKAKDRPILLRSDLGSASRNDAAFAVDLGLASRNDEEAVGRGVFVIARTLSLRSWTKQSCYSWGIASLSTPGTTCERILDERKTSARSKLYHEVAVLITERNLVL